LLDEPNARDSMLDFSKNKQRELNSPNVTFRNAVDVVALDLPFHDQNLSSSNF
jgi:hypothetical protein